MSDINAHFSDKNSTGRASDYFSVRKKQTQSVNSMPLNDSLLQRLSEYTNTKTLEEVSIRVHEEEINNLKFNEFLRDQMS